MRAFSSAQRLRQGAKPLRAQGVARKMVVQARAAEAGVGIFATKAGMVRGRGARGGVGAPRMHGRQCLLTDAPGNGPRSSHGSRRRVWPCLRPWWRWRRAMW
jgi:hypothetical protein